MGHRSIVKELHTVAGIEVGVEYTAVHYGTLRGKVRRSYPAASTVNTQIRTGIARMCACIGGILGHAGEEHSFTLRDHPLVFRALEGRHFTAGPKVHAALIEIAGGKQRHAGVQVRGTGHIAVCNYITAKLSLIALHAEERRVIYIQSVLITPVIGVLRGTPSAIVEENGIIVAVLNPVSFFF